MIFDTGRVVAADLRPASNTGRDQESQAEERRSVELRIMFRMKWARAHQAHLATENVDELGQLVEMKKTHHRADPGNARIMLMGRPRRSVPDAHVLMHRAELDHPEAAAVFANPLL